MESSKRDCACDVLQARHDSRIPLFKRRRVTHPANSEACDRIYRRVRLCGGEIGIRTFVTFCVEPLRADVCVACDGYCNIHVSSGELLQHSNRGRQSLFLFRRMAKCLAIVGLKTQVLSPPVRPNWFARDCVPTAQPRSEKYLRRICSSKGVWLAIFGDYCPCF
jgi:hypothetical protein